MTERPVLSGDEEPTVRARLAAMLLRATARPLGWGIAVAAAFLAVETLIAQCLTRTAPGSAFGAIFLLGVLVVSAGWHVGLAIATSVASTLVYLSFHPDSVAVALFVFLPVALVANLLAGQARFRAAKADSRRREADALATRQAALRRVATLVAGGAAPAEVYPVSVAEAARGLSVEHVTLVRFEPDGWGTVLAIDGPFAGSKPQAGERLSLDDDSVTARVRDTGAPARVDDGTDGVPAIAGRLRELGLQCGVGAPVTVDGVPWGALIAGSVRPGPMPTETETGDFADLVAIAIANSETRAELKASSARIVAATDQVRRDVERALHDGVQQRIAALGLGLRTIEASVSPDDQAVRLQLDHVINGLADLYGDVQDLARGIHPAILSKSGLGPALRALARRATIPVSVEVDVDRRLTESTEVAAYYVAADALTNAAEHSRASKVVIRVGLGPDELHIEVADDGNGGAASADGGSGLVDLQDRVEALSGRFDVTNPPGGGTTVTARIPWAERVSSS